MFGLLWSSGFRMTLVRVEIHIDISGSTPTSEKTPTIIKKQFSQNQVTAQ